MGVDDSLLFRWSSFQFSDRVESDLLALDDSKPGTLFPCSDERTLLESLRVNYRDGIS